MSGEFFAPTLIPNCTAINNSMGSVFGKIDVETPPYKTLLTASSYEVREFPRLLAIEAPCDEHSNNRAFGSLAGYIGVMGSAQNEAAQPIAMTAPVVNTHSKRMQFILPVAMQSAPPPLQPGLKIVERPPSRWAVATWNGGWSDEEAARRLAELTAAARSDGVQVDDSDWETHRFNPPWTLPRFKTNAVAVRVLSLPVSAAAATAAAAAECTAAGAAAAECTAAGAAAAPALPAAAVL